ncbi:MAG TPA: PAS domain-containing protein [Roseomonas sp.]|jgi:PAS domain S-box-containing protein
MDAIEAKGDPMTPVAPPAGDLQAALAISEARLRRVQRIGLVGGFEIDLDTGANHRSGEYMALHGDLPEPTIERHEDWVRRLHPEDRAAAERAFLHAIADDSGVTEYAQDYRIVTIAGEVRWISARAEIERAPDGRALRVVGAHVDITTLKLAEAALAQSRAELEEVFATLDLATVMARDIDGRILFWSRGCERLLGWTAEQARGQVARDLLQTVFPVPFPEIEATLLRDGEWTGDLVNHHRDGRAMLLATRKVLRRGAGGQPVAVMESFDDVTALRGAQAALEALNRDLERRIAEEVARREAVQTRMAHAERMQALGELAGGMAHDMRNVLQVVGSAASMIVEDVEDPERVLVLVEALRGAVTRGDTIAGRLLSFARQAELKAGPVAPDALLDELREVLEHTLGRACGCDVVVEPGLPPLLADRRQLETALVNLAVNARDAMPGGGVITLAARAETIVDAATALCDLQPGRYIRLDVADQGVGMDARTLARVVEPFFTTKPAGEGTGLGLPMAKGFAEQSGGGLAIRSTPGQGTTVSLWIPVAADTRLLQAGRGGRREE